MTAAAFVEIADPMAGEVKDDLNSLNEDDERLRVDSLLDDLCRDDEDGR